jgi:hypothetical protein
MESGSCQADPAIRHFEPPAVITHFKDHLGLAHGEANQDVRSACVLQHVVHSVLVNAEQGQAHPLGQRMAVRREMQANLQLGMILLKACGVRPDGHA